MKALTEVFDGRFENEVRQSQVVPCQNQGHDEPVSSFCKTCEIPVCKNCLFLEHKLHDFGDLQGESFEMRQHILEGVNKLEQVSKEVHEIRNSIEMNLKDCSRRKMNHINDINRAKEEFIKIVCTQAKDAEEKIIHFYVEIEKDLTVKKMEAETKCETLDQSLETCKVVAGCANDAEMVSLKNKLRDHLNVLLELPMSESHVETNRQTDIVKVIKEIPTLFNIQIVSRADGYKKEDASGQTAPVLAQNVKLDKCASSTASDIVVFEITDCKLKTDRNVPKITDLCWASDRCFVVADKHNNIAKIFDVAGKYLWQIEAPGISNVCCVEDAVVCDAEQNVLIYKRDQRIGNVYAGKSSANPFPLVKGNVSSVIMGNFRLSGKVLKEYSTDGRRMGFIETDKDIDPIRMVQKGTEEIILVIEHKSNTIQKISEDEKVMPFYHHQKGEWLPNGIDVDQQGNVHVVDGLNDCLVTISSTGQYVASRTLPIEGPIGLSINSSDVFLVGDKNGKIFKFKLR